MDAGNVKKCPAAGRDSMRRKMYMQYKEERSTAEEYKVKYLQGIEKLVSCKEQETCKKRKTYCSNLMEDKEQYRRKFAELLGWPLTEERNQMPPQVVV